MRLLTIDPSLTCTGYAVWDIRKTWQYNKHSLIFYDSVSPDATEEFHARMSYLINSIRECLREHLISLVVYERASDFHYANRGVKNYQKYTEAVHGIKYICIDFFDGSPKNVIGVTAPTWKGSGKKKDTLNKVNLFFGLDLKVKDNDIADAIGLGMWFLDRQRIAPIDYTFTG